MKLKFLSLNCLTEMTELKTFFFTNSSFEKGYHYEIRKWTSIILSANLFTTFSPIPLSFNLFSPVSFFTLFAVLIHQNLVQLILQKYQNKNHG